MSDITIRSAEEADLPAVRRLLLETWHDTYDALIGVERVTEITNSWHSIEALGAQLALSETSFLVAEQDGAIVGHAFANARRAPMLMLSRLYVLPAHQRKGIGERLLEHAIARHPACETVRLKVEADNAKGLAFYRKHSFQPTGEEIEEGIRHLLMERSASRET